MLPSASISPASIARNDSEPSNIEQSTSCPWPERARSCSAIRIPATAISAPPPRSAICAAAGHRRSVGLAGQPEDPVQAEVVDVVAGPVPVRPILAVAGDRAVDEPGVLLAQPLVSDAEAVHHARAKRFEQHVDVADQPQQHFLAGWRLQIDPDRALAAVERQEQGAAGARLGSLVVRRRPANVVAQPGVLDLDHVGAEVREQQRAEPAGKQPRQVEHLQPFQRERAHARAAAPIPSSARASSTVAGRRPASSVICRALAISSPLERAIRPSGR